MDDLKMGWSIEMKAGSRWGGDWVESMGATKRGWKGGGCCSWDGERWDI